MLGNVFLQAAHSLHWTGNLVLRLEGPLGMRVRATQLTLRLVLMPLKFAQNSGSDSLLLQGSGKTLAFGLPIMQRLLLNKEESATDVPNKLKALILAPTRELALQVLIYYLYKTTLQQSIQQGTTCPSNFQHSCNS